MTTSLHGSVLMTDPSLMADDEIPVFTQVRATDPASRFCFDEYRLSVMPTEPLITNADRAIEIVLREESGDFIPIMAGAEWTVGDLKAIAAIKSNMRLPLVQLSLNDTVLNDDDAELSDLGFENDVLLTLTKNAKFEIGQRLEAVDIRNPGLRCVASVLNIRYEGDRDILYLHFDGWSETYNYWTPVDSPNIAPCGTCQTRGVQLQKPRGLAFQDWSTYLQVNKYTPSPLEAFRNTNSSGFDEIHRRLPQRRLPQQLQIQQQRLRIQQQQQYIPSVYRPPAEPRLSDVDCSFDVTLRLESGDMQPLVVGMEWTIGELKAKILHATNIRNFTVTLESTGDELTVEPDSKLLSDTDISSEDVLTVKIETRFMTGQALEARDRKHPTYICVATIIDSRNAGTEIQLHFDGWSASYDYWTDIDTPDIAPVGTCGSMGYYLEPPRGLIFDSWQEYLSRNNREATPSEAFQTDVTYFSNGPHKSLTEFR